MDAVLYKLKEQKVTTHLSECDENPWLDEDHDTPGTSYVVEYYHPEGMHFTGYWWQGRGITKEPTPGQVMRQIFEDIADLDRFRDVNDMASEWDMPVRKAYKIWDQLETIHNQLQDFWGMTGFNEIVDNLEEGIGDDPEIDLEDTGEDGILILKTNDDGSINMPLFQRKTSRKIPGKDWGYKRDCTLVVTYGFDMKFAEDNQQAPYFSMTADVRPPGWFEGRDIVGGGAMHDDIVKYLKRLEPLVKWHLVAWPCDPMHYVENGLYWLYKVLGISEWKTESYEHPERAFRNTVLLGVHPGDEAWFEKLRLDCPAPIYSDYVKKEMRKALRGPFTKWAELRKDAIRENFNQVMQDFRLVNPDNPDASAWVPDGQFHYPCYGYTTDADHDSQNEGLMKPYVRSFPTDQGYNDAAKTNPCVSDGFCPPKRTYIAAYRAAERFAEMQARKRALPHETE